MSAPGLPEPAAPEPAAPEPGALLAATIGAIRPADPAALAAARDRQDRLTKPRGSLGALEQVAIRLAGLAGQCPQPAPDPAALAIFAADHGVHHQGVTPWPQEVTGQMVANFLAGGAAVNALARSAGVSVLVIDVGVASRPAGGSPVLDAAVLSPVAPHLLDRAVRRATADLSQAPAMTPAEAVTALETGIEVAGELVRAGYRCLLTGDMGIANTTASAALIAALTGAAPAAVTGRGTGIDDDTHARKVAVVAAGLRRHAGAVAAGDPLAIGAALGGLEHLSLAGFVLGAAAHRVPVLLDGVIAGSAALIAAGLAPAAVDACLAGHRSAEPGHGVALEFLGLEPLIDLGLRLGEGTGAVLALPLVRGAAAALREMATFDAAGVTDKGA